MEQLRYFLEDLKDASYRTLQLDSEVIPILTDFLLNCDETKQIAILCSLDWLNHFIDFFREDFIAVLDRAKSVYIDTNQQQQTNSVSQSANNLAGIAQVIEEENKELRIEEEVKDSRLI